MAAPNEAQATNPGRWQSNPKRPEVPKTPVQRALQARGGAAPLRARGLTEELVIDAKTGQPRQAGTLGEHGRFILDYRKRAEESLYVFGKTVMGYNLLTAGLHLPYCRVLQHIPPYRKLTLMPRLHYKTTVAKSLAVHTFIQPADNNVYYPGGFPHLGHGDGRSGRVLFASTTVDLAKSILGEITMRIETTNRLHALWPHCFWENPRRQAPHWNQEKITLPRTDVFKEGSIEATGVDGSKTGFHYDFHIFDDLIDRKARNSPTTMQSAIEWFTASRAFMEDQTITREFTFGTHWAVNDLYTHIRQNDPSVECYVRSIVEPDEDGVLQPIMPERFSSETIEQMKLPPPLGYGVLFPLLYMNNVIDPELVDFDMNELRYFMLEDGIIHFDEDERDEILHKYLIGDESPRPKAKPWARHAPETAYAQDDDFNAYEDYMMTRYGS